MKVFISVLSFFLLFLPYYAFKFYTELHQLRAAVRRHRDQRLDDRCWMDDYELYEALPEGLDGCTRDWYGKKSFPFVDQRLLPPQEMLQNCAQYIHCRSVNTDPQTALIEYQLWKRKKEAASKVDMDWITKG